MKHPQKHMLMILAVTLISIIATYANAQTKDPWSAKQLLEPAELNKTLADNKAPKTYIFSVGYQAIIKNSIDIGPTVSAENQKKLKKELEKLPKDANIVIYCGCCPFDHCPNIRPAFTILNEMGFKNQKLLNLPHNIKSDWIDKGYAVKK